MRRSTSVPSWSGGGSLRSEELREGPHDHSGPPRLRKSCRTVIRAKALVNLVRPPGLEPEPADQRPMLCQLTRGAWGGAGGCAGPRQPSRGPVAGAMAEAVVAGWSTAGRAGPRPPHRCSAGHRWWRRRAQGQPGRSPARPGRGVAGCYSSTPLCSPPIARALFRPMKHAGCSAGGRGSALHGFVGRVVEHQHGRPAVSVEPPPRRPVLEAQCAPCCRWMQSSACGRGSSGGLVTPYALDDVMYSAPVGTLVVSAR